MIRPDGRSGSAATQALLLRLEAGGFDGAPRVLGDVGVAAPWHGSTTPDGEPSASQP